MPCTACGCPEDAPAHAVSGALKDDDLDRALDLGLLEVEACPSCTGPCSSALLDARDDRQRAFAARDRHRTRTARLACRAEARKQKRVEAEARPASLPPAAAAALARALSRVGKPR